MPLAQRNWERLARKDCSFAIACRGLADDDTATLKWEIDVNKTDKIIKNDSNLIDAFFFEQNYLN